MEYRLARTYEEMGYKIIPSSIVTENNKTYADAEAKCGKCGGTGLIPYFGHIDNGTCFDCHGLGKSIKKHCRIYTENERAKLDEQAARRAEKKEAEKTAQAENKVKEWKQKYNIEDGIIYIVAGCNTFDIKDKLKEDGAKFYTGLNWFFGTNTAPTNFQYGEGAFLYKCTFEDVFEPNKYGEVFFKTHALDKIKNDISQIINTNNKNTSKSQHFGNVGDRIRKQPAIFKKARVINGDWGSSMLYTFAIGDNIFTWFTQSCIDNNIQINDTILLSGTIKAHTEYNGVLQTQLSRCIVKSCD
jgi:hypothetical protein